MKNSNILRIGTDCVKKGLSDKAYTAIRCEKKFLKLLKQGVSLCKLCYEAYEPVEERQNCPPPPVIRENRKSIYCNKRRNGKIYSMPHTNLSIPPFIAGKVIKNLCTGCGRPTGKILCKICYIRSK